MPKGGIAVSVTFPDAPGSRKPLQLRLPRRPAVMLEGTTDTPEYRIMGRTDGWNVSISIDIRSSHPTAAQLDEAQRVVTSIRFG
jgi:hypothetical protein